MKKKLISVLMIVVMLCSLGGLAYADNVKDLRARDGVEFVPGTVPAESVAMDGMIPPVNALVMSMLEHGLAYDENSDVFLWNSVYYMISLYGQMDSRAELTDDRLILPSETVEDYAAALFSNYRGLPELPEQMKDRVTYNASSDTYSLARGDAGLSETQILQVSYMANGGAEVFGAVISLADEQIMCTFTADLYPNNSMFGYSIAGLNIE